MKSGPKPKAGKPARKSAGKKPAAAKRSSGSRAARITVLLVLNAALIALVWQVAGPRLLAAARGTVAEPAPAAAPDSIAPATRVPAQRAFAAARRDSALEEKVRALVHEAVARAASESKGRVQAGAVSVAVHVRDAADGAEIVALHAGRAQRPASNLKLVTTASALVLLGPDWHFTTPFTSTAAIVEGVLRGDLVVHGAGDPLYDPSTAGGVEVLLAPAIEQLKAAGLRRVAGDLVLDEGRFADPGPGPAWPADGQRWSEFCALSGAFSANAGCITATVRPGAVGGAAHVEIRPRGHGLPQKIDVRTGAAKSKLDVRVSAVGGTVVVEGSVPANVPEWSCRFAAPDPVELFGGALHHALQAEGIEVAGRVRRERAAVQSTARPLAAISTSLLDVLTPINAHSNNACADQLFFALGNEQFGAGTRAGGRAASLFALEQLGVPDDGFAQVDGSGLSRDNQVSAQQITALLAGVSMRGGRAADALLESMAAPRADGTLDERLEGLEGRVRAKTGFIGGTSALSGVLEAEAGRRLVFSILVEYPVVDGLNTKVWKPMQDKICRALAGVRG